MRKYTKIFIIFALLVLTIIITKFFFEYKNLQDLKVKIVKDEAKSLSALIVAFRQTYQKSFIDNAIPIDNKTIHLLPVRTTKDIGDLFSKIINHKAT